MSKTPLNPFLVRKPETEEDTKTEDKTLIEGHDAFSNLDPKTQESIITSALKVNNLIGSAGFDTCGIVCKNFAI